MLSMGRWPSASGCKLLSQFVQLSVLVSLFYLLLPSFLLSCIAMSFSGEHCDGSQFKGTCLSSSSTEKGSCFQDTCGTS